MKVKHEEVHLEIGEAGSDDWNDSTAFDQSIYDASKSRADLARISQLMARAVVTPMRIETGSVGEFND